MRRTTAAIVMIGWLLSAGVLAAARAAEIVDAHDILRATGVKGGLVVHVGCGDGRLTADLRANDSFLVHGLDRDPARVEAARAYLRSRSLYGPVSVDHWDGRRLPYVNNLVNLVVAQEPATVADDELLRALAPNGVAYVQRGGAWTKRVKPRPADIDEWTHYLHDPSNNAVAHDAVVGPPRRMQWLGSPRYGRHHDRMSSFSAAVSAGGRIFYIFDEASPVSALFAPQWSVIARDAFNGVVLWKRRISTWHTHLFPLKSGPAILPRRLVADGDHVYVTLSLDGPVVALDAATGKSVRTYQGTEGAEEILLSEGVLYLVVRKPVEGTPSTTLLSRPADASRTDGAGARIVALRAGTGETLWRAERLVLPITLAVAGAPPSPPKVGGTRGGVFFHDGERVVCLDRTTGNQVWISEPVERRRAIPVFFAPTLVVYQDVVLFSGGSVQPNANGGGDNKMAALSAETGKLLWSADHPSSGYKSPEDILVANGLVWTGETTNPGSSGVVTGRDPRTGEVKAEFGPDVETYWFHHRCHRGKATDRFLLMSRTGIEFVDVAEKSWQINHWVRGACLYGIMPANGLIYAPQHPCACYSEAKLYGLNALAPALPGPRVPDVALRADRLERGPAYGEGVKGRRGEGEKGRTGEGETAQTSGAPAIGNRRSAIGNPDDWPTYRHDAARSGRAGTVVPAKVQPIWQAEIGGRLTSPVIAEGKLLVASIDTHTVHAFDAATGRRAWQYTAGGRVDSPPTLYQGRVLFGSADGWVYCLRADDGALAWRFRAAPMDQRTMAFEQLESVWPVHGSVLIQNGILYCIAGRSMFLDGGLRFLRLDPLTGRLLSETVLDDREAPTDKDLQEYVSWLNMPTALPDILSSDGRLVYMRSQPFGLDGARLPLKAFPKAGADDRGAPPATQYSEHSHLFSPTGFLDDTWWHRTYWMYGSTFVSGWCGYYLSGQVAPAGRMMVFDDARVYGFGRKPQYYRWTVPKEDHLFAADRMQPAAGNPVLASAGSPVRVSNSPSLDPSGKPLTVAAWVKAEAPDGAILARGGDIQGYALYLQGGRPHFALRVGKTLTSVSAPEKVGQGWVHLAGVLSAEKELRIYVNGALAASAKAPEPIPEAPQQATEIGSDEGGPVGSYKSPFALTGLVDEVQVYHRALSAAEIAKCAASAAEVDRTGLVLACSFDKGDTADASGRGNHGKTQGGVFAPGKVGQALRLVGKVAAVPGFQVKHHWAKAVPLFARAMILSGETLFIAGPADLVDEEQALKQIDEPETQRRLAAQQAALDGKQGASLWAVSVAGGERLSECKLDGAPVFDGMAAAGQRLFLATVDGRVVCLGKAP